MINESTMTIFANQVAVALPSVLNLVHLSFRLEIESVKHPDSEVHRETGPHVTPSSRTAHREGSQRIH